MRLGETFQLGGHEFVYYSEPHHAHKLSVIYHDCSSFAALDVKLNQNPTSFMDFFTWTVLKSQHSIVCIQSDEQSVMNKYRNHMATCLLRSSKTSGRRKLRRDQSSAKLFCSGVPVNNSLLSVGSNFSSRTSRQFRFLILWPSSTIRYFHWKCWDSKIIENKRQWRQYMEVLKNFNYITNVIHAFRLNDN